MSPFNGAYSAVKSTTPLINHYHKWAYSTYVIRYQLRLSLCTQLVHLRSRQMTTFSTDTADVGLLLNQRWRYQANAESA